MTDFRWTLDRLETAERALERHRAKVEAGERDAGCVMAKPACNRGCAVCDLECAVIAGCIETARRGLAHQARVADHTWRLKHGGNAYSETQGCC